jgi:hypothetical protein
LIHASDCSHPLTSFVSFHVELITPDRLAPHAALRLLMPIVCFGLIGFCALAARSFFQQRRNGPPGQRRQGHQATRRKETMNKLALTLTTLSLLAAPALAGNIGSGTAAGYGSTLKGAHESTSRQSTAPAARPTSSIARSFNFSGQLPTKEDFRRSRRR